jgi:hypothetical protein
LVRAETNRGDKKKLLAKLINIDNCIMASFCNLLKKLYYFNFAEDICKFILRCVYTKNLVIRKLIEDFIEYFMSITNVNSGQMKLYILTHFGKIIKQKRLFVRMNPSLFKAVSNLTVDDGTGYEDRTKKLDGFDQKLID